MRLSEFHAKYRESWPDQKIGCDHSRNIHGKNKGIKKAWKIYKRNQAGG